MDQERTAARLAAVAAIRNRVSAVCGGWLRADECLQIAIVACTRGCAALSEFMFTSQLARAVQEHQKAVAITHAEFDVIFGSKSVPVRAAEVDAVVSETSFASSATRLKNALRTTIDEGEQAQLWQRPWSRTVCVLAVNFENHEEGLATALGNLVRADVRRLEDLRQDLEDEGIDVMLLSSVVGALARSV
jgi:hypothetical protein